MNPKAESPAWGRGGVYLALAVGYLVLVFGLSHIPGGLFSFRWLRWDKVIHFAEYVPLGFLITGWLINRRSESGGRVRVFATSAIILVALGALDELHQYFVPNRGPTVADAIADALGGFVGATIGIVLFTVRERRSRLSRRRLEPLDELDTEKHEQSVKSLASNPEALRHRSDDEQLGDPELIQHGK